MAPCRTFVFAALSCLLTACATNPTSPPPALQEREAAPYLTQDYAQMRAQQVSDVRYAVSVELDQEQPSFTGSTAIAFNLADNQVPLTVDFNGGEIASITLNGQPVDWDYNGWFITLAADDLSTGSNRLVIEYSRPYANDGDGLHRYQDPQTGNVYLYSNFEPYNANKLFPHFDQPNIKASYTLDVLAPKSWHVISATHAKETRNAGTKKHWFFPESAVIPSYIFPLHAGPFAVWESEYTGPAGTIPLRLFARQELESYVVEEDWFTFTKQSFDFFNDYFGLPYPFGKYDQLIVPDFNAGAMENLAAVTFSERFVKRGTKLTSERVSLANVIAHEMAHMWFGNLVTMNWWNGLWLNESFATYMAYLQLAEASDFADTWNTFYARTKQWAYETDQRITSHPIELPVPTTADAFTNFDGITYGKGASMLKQLPHYLGADAFRQGIVNYLKEHAYGNTELEDFTAALAHAAGQDLETWVNDWLHRPGLNSIQARFSCDNGLLTELRIEQSAPDAFPSLRSQKINIGLFQVADQARLLKAVPVIYEGETTDVSIDDTDIPCPDLVYPNYQDWAFVKVRLDAESKKTLLESLQAFTDPGLRTMLWQSLWDSAYDAELPLNQFVHFAYSNIDTEQDDEILAQVARQILTASQFLWASAGSVAHGKQETYAQLRHLMADTVWQQTMQAQSGSDRQKILFDTWVALAETPAQLQQLRTLLDTPAAAQRLPLDQDRRWAMVAQLARYQQPGVAALIEQELVRDPSERGHNNALIARAVQPDLSIKRLWLARVLDADSEYKLAQKSAVMSNLFPASQISLLQEMSADILAALPSIAESRDERFVDRFAKHLLPNTCTQQAVEQLQASLVEVLGKNPILDRALQEEVEETERCIAISERLLHATP